MAKKKESIARPGTIGPMAKGTAIIRVPLGTVGEGEYLSRHVESRLKTREQQLAMKRLLRGLQEKGAKTRDGRPVGRPGDAVRWLMEQVAGQADEGKA